MTRLGRFTNLLFSSFCSACLTMVATVDVFGRPISPATPIAGLCCYWFAWKLLVWERQSYHNYASLARFRRDF